MAITSFSPTNGSSLTVDNSKYYVQNANQSWSLQEPNTDTLRFELRSGDHWSSSGYSDPTSAERSEAGGGTLYSAGTQINVSYEFMVEPGATNTAKWIVLGQMHEDSAGYSPPFAVELVNGDHMAIDIGTGSEVYLYKDPNPIERGHYYSMDVQVKFDANGNGFLRVWRDGVQIVDYHGSIGTGAATYWKEGVYRSAAPETMAVNYRNLHITTGAASAPTTPTQPTTPTTPITPSPIAPPRSITPTSPTTPANSTTPTAPTTPTTQTTPTSSVTTPVLTVANPALSVMGRGGTVGLGVNVSTTNTNERVTVNGTGLPKHETITSALGGQMFRGRDITLTAAQVSSGLTLTSSYRGGGDPVATPVLTSNTQDPVSGVVASAEPQSISVSDPRPSATSMQPTAVMNPPPASGTRNSWTGQLAGGVNQQQPTSTGATSGSQPISARDLSAAISTVMVSPAAQGFALSNQFRSLVAGGSTAAPAAPAVTNDARSTSTTTASLASQSFALLNQYLAGSTGRVDHGQIVASVSNGAAAGQVSFLTRPQH
ncbi:heparin lyase I family protein [Bradyrhizobium sp. BWA-3-5]|uniref:heparin lyase I family protein n=1 Tax=Bradyrhizobium sp. BWA-3-5 TaxID=3080013 RepID=UPI00293F3055|nr:heparin lyase I family protein [Bradyrhizobium sp. BWA-3-5]WOH67865.1 heparin lyase I family protein [Bradyrhizobium sp. BWA-3-5]